MRVHQQSEEPRPVVHRGSPAPVPRGLLALQATAGNAAVTSLVVQRAITLTDERGHHPLTIRQACDLLEGEEHHDLPFAAVRQLWRQNWTGTRADFLRAAQDLRHLSGPAIEDFYAAQAAQYAATVRANATPRVVLHDYDQVSQAISHLRKSEDAVDMDEALAAKNARLGTASLATCIAVGMTFADHTGARFTALAHMTAAQQPADVFDDLEDELERLDGYPMRNERVGVRYFVVGGSRDSARLQVELLEHMIARRYLGGDVVLVNDRELRRRTKVVVVDADGTVRYGVSTTDHAA
ncbi:hypothetical protein [Saccharothrix variisporea]|uniref:Uncharacterized protein n=1 Tax=Saccharothrix variisporea TaxID=543527 RepID=A0A495XAK4_9PSEU|nr:hypothetical protein [Saccharothrix variisporea]RKT71300.1 hypothetical protein DFJ66_4583 [Saccharothrix variisporea]